MAKTMAEHLIEQGIEQGETRAKQEVAPQTTAVSDLVPYLNL